VLGLIRFLGGTCAGTTRVWFANRRDIARLGGAYPLRSLLDDRPGSSLTRAAVHPAADLSASLVSEGAAVIAIDRHGRGPSGVRWVRSTSWMAAAHALMPRGPGRRRCVHTGAISARLVGGGDPHSDVG